MRKTYPAAFKMKVALEAVSGQRSIAELASRHEVSAKVIGDWKKQLLSAGEEIFSAKRKRRSRRRGSYSRRTASSRWSLTG